MSERLGALRRHRFALLLTFAIGAVITVLLTLFLPAVYRSSATILIEQQEVPQDLVRSTITSFADQRVQIISQRVMTGQNLTSIADRYNLYPWQRRTRAREVVIEKMREDIGLRMISANVVDPRSGRPTQATIAFAVSYESRSPDLAVKVANELTSLYLNENLTMRTAAAQQTAVFLSEEGDRLRDDIQVLAEKISKFKQQHANALPELAGVNFQILDRTEVELRDANTRLGSIDQQRVLLQAQLAQINPTSQIYAESGQRILSPSDRLKTLKADLASLKARYGPDHPDIAKAEREMTGLQAEVSADNGANDLLRQLAAARAELAAATDHYSPQHPDVLRLTRRVASLEEQVKTAPAADRVRNARTNPDNPAFIQLTAQFDGLQTERDALVRKISELHARLDDFQRRLSQSPEVEREFRALGRDYDNAQLKYQEVRSKQREAEAAKTLEAERKGERFTMIEPPLPPEQPISPNRPAVLLLGMFASLLAALLVAFVRESRTPTVRGVVDLTRLLEVAPLAVIPVIVTSDDVSRRASSARYVLFGAVGAVLLAVLSVHLFVRPLDILWLSFLRRIGL
jgi:polysaccharide biosynthesis transport protein